MVAGILGFKDNTPSGISKVVYTVPTGKIAVVNIFASGVTGISIGGAAGMDSTDAAINLSIGSKGIVLQAGAYVKFSGYTTGIVTGFEEDA